MKETREQFEKRYSEIRTPGRNKFETGEVLALRCTCEDGGEEPHWAAVPNNPQSILDHWNHEETLEEIRCHKQ